MNPSILDDYEGATASDGSNAREDVIFSRDDEVSKRYPVWTPEDITGPDPWTLASFSDLLPHEPD